MNKKLEADFKAHLESIKVTTTTSYSNGGYYKERCDVSFYEWGDLNSIPKRFNNSKEFFKFLDECKIEITNIQKLEFDDHYTFYATCYKDSNVICIASSKVNLEKAIQKNIDTNEIPNEDDRRAYEKKTLPANRHTPIGCGQGYYPNRYGYDDYGYDCWD